MTLSQFIDYVRDRHRAQGDTNWSDAEIYSLITGRCNEVLSVIGLLENTGTFAVVATVANYPFTSVTSGTDDIVRIKQLEMDGEALQEISFRDRETIKSGGTTPSGTPEQWYQWNRVAYLIPTPSAGGTATVYWEHDHPFIDNSAQTTIDIPAVLHWRLADGVLSDMFAKDLNSGFTTHYENLWNQKHMPAFYKYKARLKRGSRARVIVDADSHIGTDFGVI